MNIFRNLTSLETKHGKRMLAVQSGTWEIHYARHLEGHMVCFQITLCSPTGLNLLAFNSLMPSDAYMRQ